MAALCRYSHHDDGSGDVMCGYIRIGVRKRYFNLAECD